MNNKTFEQVINFFKDEARIIVRVIDSGNVLDSFTNVCVGSDRLKKYSKCEVVSIEYTGEYIIIYLDKVYELDDDTEYYFRVTQAAESYSTGYVKMTPKQAKFVNFVADCDNWKYEDIDTYSGTFSVALDDWKTVEEVEGV